MIVYHLRRTGRIIEIFWAAIKVHRTTTRIHITAKNSAKTFNKYSYVTNVNISNQTTDIRLTLTLRPKLANWKLYASYAVPTGCTKKRPSCFADVLNPLECRGSYNATSNDMKLVHVLLMGGLLHSVQQGADWAGPQPAQALLAVPNVTAHPSTASVPTTVLLYHGQLFCGFTVADVPKGTEGTKTKSKSVYIYIVN